MIGILPLELFGYCTKFIANFPRNMTACIKQNGYKYCHL
ncbi:hypothetical protein X874_4320 [Mannheimia varigena USDA-ARS-USMARC-1312]|nr:hypothetical protein X874_4320 [Mannheimia varigena USDA-ARS-USMARC-1312]AHG80273.1 hypothetical protein X875_16550 [Mannheimia varigena USDA-ARS-USMARC-1388]